MIAKFKMRKDGPQWSDGIKAGDIVYLCMKYDYGTAADDTLAFGEPYISVTRDETGDYPFFTVPKSSLENIPPTPQHRRMG